MVLQDILINEREMTRLNYCNVDAQLVKKIHKLVIIGRLGVQCKWSPTGFCSGLIVFFDNLDDGVEISPYKICG